MAVDQVITRGGPVAVPLDYVVPTGTEILPRTVSALLNGGAAGGAFVPVLEVIAPTGAITAYCARRVSIAAGASVLVSWFPGVAEADDDGSSSSGGSPTGSAGGDLTGSYPNPSVHDVSILTTLGDLLVRGAAAPATRLPVGADGLVLQADSLQAAGMKWASVGGAGAFEYDYVESSSALTVTATTEGTANTYITGNPVTYDGATRVKLEFACTNVGETTGTGVISIFEDGATIGWLIELNFVGGASSWSVPLYAARFFTPSAGTHTYTIRAWKTAGTMILTAKTAATKQELPAWYRITKA